MFYGRIGSPTKTLYAFIVSWNTEHTDKAYDGEVQGTENTGLDKKNNLKFDFKELESDSGLD
jgi:hypothetical protein